MPLKIATWELGDLSQAMANAIFQNAHDRYLKQNGDILKFNGFWRNGDKQNVCAWLNKAAWHDAKTGEGGGCKEFARVAFNLDLKEFMCQFGGKLQPLLIKKTLHQPKSIDLQIAVGEIWKKLRDRDLHREDLAAEWLSNQRGFNEPRSNIGSGFANLYSEDIELFDKSLHAFLKHRLSLGPQLVVPIRNYFGGETHNLFFRSISNTDKGEKSRLLPGYGGWGSDDNMLRAFGLPHLIHDFPEVILCEGMADYFAVECLLGQSSSHLPIGVPSASALPKWATFLSQTKFSGHIILIYQLDVDPNGEVSSSAVGQIKATEALRIFLKNKISVSLFDWAGFLKESIPIHKIPKDIADMFLSLDNFQNLSFAFRKILNRTGQHGYSKLH
jgi:hypothetical protein